MRNKLFTLAIVLPLLLGCGLADRVMKSAEPEVNKPKIEISSNKSLTDQAVDTAVGEEKIGIAECDEALDLLSEQASNPDDNFMTKAVKKTALNTFRDQLKKNLEENKTDKKEVAKFCREFRNNLQDSANENTNQAK
jgi:hypothetical protein